MKIIYRSTLFTMAFNCLFFTNITIGMESFCKIFSNENENKNKSVPSKKEEDLIELHNFLKNRFNGLGHIPHKINEAELTENINTNQPHKTLFAGTKTYGFNENDCSFNNDLEFIRLMKIFLEKQILPELERKKDINILLVGAGKMSLTVAFMIHILKKIKSKVNNLAQINIFYNDVDKKLYDIFMQRLLEYNLQDRDINIIPLIGDIGTIHQSPQIEKTKFRLILEENLLHLFNNRQEYDCDMKIIYDKMLKNRSQWNIPNIIKNMFNLLSDNGRLLMTHRGPLFIPQKPTPPLSIANQNNKRDEEQGAFYNDLDIKLNNINNNNNLNEQEKIIIIIHETKNLLNKHGKYINLSEENIVPHDFFHQEGQLIDFLLAKKNPPIIRLNYINKDIQHPIVKDFDLAKKETTKEILLTELTKNPLITIFESFNNDFTKLKEAYQLLRSFKFLPVFQISLTIQK